MHAHPLVSADASVHLIAILVLREDRIELVHELPFGHLLQVRWQVREPDTLLVCLAVRMLVILRKREVFVK